jgi:hypothetical protein
MLAAYRDIENTELDAHLEQCSDCREVLAQQSLVGDGVRLLPTLEPAPDAHDKLMRVLAAEHASFLQRSSHIHASSASSVPDFLKPYMKEQTYTAAQRRNTLTTFSTAETGPLPMLQARRKKRIAPMGQLAVLGLAASFLMVFLIGGLISVLIIASHGSNNLSSTTSSIAPPSLVAPISYTTTTAYPHISSAVATREHIYYSAYGDGNIQWMIEQVDSSARNATSIPLLAKGSDNPVFVLAASQNWLIWLQFDTPQRGTQTHAIGHTDTASLTRHWSLNALPLSTSHNQTQPFAQSITLEQGTFDTASVPSWVYTPIQGLAFAQQDTLLTATVNAKGGAQVTRYELSTEHATTATTIATTDNGHIFTSPTATADGSRIFWSEEWFTEDMQPHSNVWMQQTTQTVTRQNSAWRPSITIDKQLFLADEVSFHPQVINNTLFLLTTSDSVTQTSRKPDATSTPTQATSGTATPVSTAPVVPRFTNVYAPQIDESIHGTLLAYALDDSTANPTVLSSDNTAAAPQGGTRFLLWQSSSGYQMYDAVAKSPVEVKNNTSSVAFLTVNGDTAVWVAAENPSIPSTGTTQTATFSMFNWPA